MKIVQFNKISALLTNKNSKNDSFLYLLILFNFALKGCTGVYVHLGRGVQNPYTPAE